jgi:hypothetical protein
VQFKAGVEHLLRLGVIGCPVEHHADPVKHLGRELAARTGNVPSDFVRPLQVGMGLGHAGGHRADADLGHQLDRDVGLGVGVLEVEDELGQVLDRINIMVRRRRDQRHARRRMA